MTFQRLRSMLLQRLALAMIVLLSLSALAPQTAVAGPGHGHGDGSESAPAAAALPRFVATSERFELVGVVEGQRLTLYVDDAATNTPVKDARLELTVGSTPVPTTPEAEGEFSAQLPAELRPGITPVRATVAAASGSSALAGEIDIHSSKAQRHGARPWMWWMAGAAGSAVALLGLVTLLKRAARTTRPGASA